MKALIGWFGVLLGSVGLGFFLYGQLASGPPSQVPVAATYEPRDVREPRPTIYVTETEHIVDPGKKIYVDVPVAPPAPPPSEPAPVLVQVAESDAQLAPAVAPVLSSPAPAAARDEHEDERDENDDDSGDHEDERDDRDSHGEEHEDGSHGEARED